MTKPNFLADTAVHPCSDRAPDVHTNTQRYTHQTELPTSTQHADTACCVRVPWKKYSNVKNSDW